MFLGQCILLQLNDHWYMAFGLAFTFTILFGRIFCFICGVHALHFDFSSFPVNLAGLSNSSIPKSKSRNIPREFNQDEKTQLDLIPQITITTTDSSDHKAARSYAIGTKYSTEVEDISQNVDAADRTESNKVPSSSDIVRPAPARAAPPTFEETLKQFDDEMQVASLPVKRTLDQGVNLPVGEEKICKSSSNTDQVVITFFCRKVSLTLSKAAHICSMAQSSNINQASKAAARAKATG